MSRHLLRSAVLALAVVAFFRGAAAQVQAPEGRARTVSPTEHTKWVVDPVHSQVEFGIRHLLGRVRGTFTKWYGVLETPQDDWKRGTVNVQVQTASITTGNSYRDADLRSPRFLSTDSFPTMTFHGTGIVATDSTVELRGILTLHGHSHEVVLKGRFDGMGKDQEHKDRIAFDAATIVNRRDYGIRYNEMVEGSKMVGDDVEISISLEAVRAS